MSPPSCLLVFQNFLYIINTNFLNGLFPVLKINVRQEYLSLFKDFNNIGRPPICQ